MVSPLSKIGQTTQIIKDREEEKMLETMLRYDLPASKPLSPLSKTPPQTGLVLPQTVIKDDDIEKLGGNISRAVSQTSEKIVAKMSVQNFEELGAALIDVRNQAGKLDPNSIQKRGILGWWQRIFGDVKKELTMRLKNADAVFDQLDAKLNTHINVNKEWIKDLDILYAENLKRYQEINQVMEVAKEWRQNLEDQLANWPEILPEDPDANLKLQNLADAKARLNRIQIKQDMFLRLKTWTESNFPKIRSQQETSRTTVQTLTDVITQTIPMIKIEFSLFIQSLDVQKSIQLVDSTKDLANTTLIRSADSAKDAAVNAATSLNTPMIATNTLNHIKTRMLETFQEVENIRVTSQAVREADKVQIEESQKQYLSALQKIPNAI